MILRRILKYSFGICGVALLVDLVRKVGFAKVSNSVEQIGWGELAIIALGGIAFMVRALAWRETLGGGFRSVPFWDFFRWYLIGESVGSLFFGGAAVSDTTRVYLLRNFVPTATVISSVALDRGLYLAGSAVVLAATICLLPLVPKGQVEIPRFGYTAGTVFIAIMAGIWVAMRRRVRLISGLLSLSSKIGPLRNWIERKRSGAIQIEGAIFHFLDTDRPGFWLASALNLAAHGLAILEVLLLLWFLGATPSLFIALLAEGMTKIVNIGGNVIPGNVGVYEAANMMIFKFLGMQSAFGLTMALCRDLRRFFWLAVGLALFFVSRDRTPEA